MGAMKEHTSGILGLLGRRILFADGGMGSQLQARGLAPGEAPESWNLARPDDVVAVHRAYFEAGSDYVLTNTFGANPLKSPGTDLRAVVSAAVRNARRAAESLGEKYVGLDVGPTGKLLAPVGDLDFEEAVAAFAETVRAGAAAGADFIAVETMNDLYELKAAVLAAKESCDLPVFATVTFDAKGKLLTGADVPAVVALLEGLGVDALGLNCGLGPEQAEPRVRELLDYASVPVIVKPNAGLPRLEDGRTVYDVGPDEFAARMEPLARMGALVLGGCCGTTPAHIAALVARTKDVPATPVSRKDRTLVSSYTHATEISAGHPILVGERINPTGKARLKQALLGGDLPYVFRQGIEQQEAGAHVLDVNVGLPGIDEKEMLLRVSTGLQALLDLPLQLDTADPAALEAAMRRYNGKPMVNSVNGKRSSMDAVFPLVRKYGGVTVCLCLDENGIPPTAEGRLAIARRIVETAESYGIDRKDLVVDLLCMAVSADPAAARTTLEGIRLVRQELGVNVCLGVSNVSFGLPSRTTLNAAFFTAALAAGLTAAIVNPNSVPMLEAFRAHRALAGLDPDFADYIAAHAADPAPGAATPAKPAADATLSACIARGLRADAAARAAADLAGGTDPLALIDGEIVPALDGVGRLFEAGTLFLPQLLAAADAAGAAFEKIKGAFAAAGTARARLGQIALATVQGDIHDIGKNIVRVLLENYGFDVIDLGKDVPPETVVACVRRHGLRLVGLSALMTTTVGAMEETIRRLREEAPDCRVMVGGAVLTEAYAKEIGADFYSKDAMGSVRYALSLFSAKPDA